MGERVKGLLLAIIGILVLTPDGMLVRLIDAEPWVLLFWRGGGTFLIVGLFIVLRYRRDALRVIAAAGLMGVVVGALLSATNIFFIMAITQTTAANTLAMISISPLFAAVLSWFVLDERPPFRTWLALAAAGLAVTIIVSGTLGHGGATSQALVGDLFAIATGLTMATAVVLVRRSRSVSMVPAIAIGGIISVLASVAAGANPGEAVSPSTIVPLAVLCVVLPVAFTMLTLSARYLPAPEVGMIMLLEMIFGPLWVWIAVNEVPAPQTFIGGAILLATLIGYNVAMLTELRRQSVIRQP